VKVISVTAAEAAITDHESTGDDFVRRLRFADRTGHFNDDPELDGMIFSSAEDSHIDEALRMLSICAT